MTSLLEKGSALKSKSSANLGAPGQPQVDLLPPEVRAGRGLSRVKRWLGFALVLTVVVAAAVYGFAFLTERTAKEHLADAQQTSVELAKERKKYAEVPVVLGAITDVKAARLLGASSEVAWQPYLDAITAILPANASIETFTVTQGSPTASTPVPGDILSDPGVASVSFTTRSATMLDSSVWLDALDSIPGFTDPTLQGVMLGEKDGIAYYSVTSTVEVDITALAHRFVNVEE